MKGQARALALSAALWLAAAFLGARIHRTFVFPFPPFPEMVFDLSPEFGGLTSYERPLGTEAGYRDFAGLLFGLRRLTADIALIGILQYYGSHEVLPRDHEEGGAETEHAHGFGGGRYSALGKMTLRVTRLDPRFHYAWLYGAGSLAFNLNRPEEALVLFEEAIRADPQYWRYRLYVGAIVYKQKGKFDEMVRLLEDAIRYPDCPTMVKSVLANIYKDRGRYTDALRIWLGVLESERADAWYRSQAERNIEELRAKLGL